MFNNSTIQTTRYGLNSEKTNGEIVIAHLSDLHEKRFGRGNEQLFKKVRLLRPDIIAVTGDLILHETQGHPNIAYMKQLAFGLSAIAPAFFVTGNHEFLFDKEVTQALSEGGLTVIRKGIYTMDIRGTRVNISGMDDLSYGLEGLEEAAAVFEGVEGFNIFLTHRPEIFDLLLDRNIDLVLAGHTHAGQIRIPFISKLFMPGQGWFPKYMQGEFTDGSTTMIISRGLGSSGYPAIRINNPPDLVAVYVEAMENSYSSSV